MIEKEKPNFSISAFGTVMRCGCQYHYRYNEGLKIPPGIAAVVGLATDDTVTMDLTAKKDSGVLCKTDEVQDKARDGIMGHWQKGVRLVGDELKENQKKLKGEAVDDAVTLSLMHHRTVAPVLLPIGLQRFFKIELDNYPMNLSGRIDVEEPDSIRDTKTSKKTPSIDEADKSDQLTFYALERKIKKGSLPASVHLDYLIRTKTPKVVSLKSDRNDRDIDQMFRLIDRTMDIVEKGAFMPSRNGWWCSEKYCGYWADVCPFGRRGAVTSYPSTQEDMKHVVNRARKAGAKK